MRKMLEIRLVLRCTHCQPAHHLHAASNNGADNSTAKCLNYLVVVAVVSLARHVLSEKYIDSDTGRLGQEY